MLRFDPHELGLNGTADGTTTTSIGFYDTEDAADPTWSMEHRPDGNLVVHHAAVGTTPASDAAWFDATGGFHVQTINVHGESGVDAGTLDGLDSTQFVRSDVAATAASINVTGALTKSGNAVLTTADEGTLNAGTLGGASLDTVRPDALDNGTLVNASPTGHNFGQYLEVTGNADGTVTVDSVGGNAVGSTASASGDAATTRFTVQHNLGTTPASVDITPLTNDTKTDFYVTNVTATSLDIVYAAAPPTGTGNLEWYVTAFGNDGSGKHAVEVQDDGLSTAYADTVNFGSGLVATDNTGGRVTIDAAVDTAVSVSDDGTQVVAEAATLDFGSNIDVTATGDTATMNAQNTYPSVSNGGVVTVAAPTDINAGDNLTAVDDGDQTVTLHASGDAATLGGLSSGQFLRSDVNDSHDATLSLTTLAATGTDVTMPAGVGFSHGSGTATAHRIRVREDGQQTRINGANLGADYGISFASDAQIIFAESDTGRVSGWVDTNNDSLTMGSGVRVGDTGGVPSDALDVRGNANMNGGELKSARVENRTSDPTDPQPGQMWIRTDL